MIMFLYGSDSFRVQQRVNYYKQESLAQGVPEHAIWLLDLAEEHDLDTLLKTIGTVNLFDEKKIVVVRNIFEKPEIITKLITSYNLDRDTNTYLILYELTGQKELQKKDKALFSQLTKTPVISESATPLEGNALQQWVVALCKEYSCTIEPSALQKLIMATNRLIDKTNILISNSARIYQEITKLANYAHAQQSSVITAQYVELLVEANANDSIFLLTDACANRDKRQAITLLRHYLEDNNADPFYIYSMFLFQYRNLIMTKSLLEQGMQPSAIAQQLDAKPYVVQKATAYARKYEFDELKKLYQNLAELDQSVKYGQADMTDGLYNFVINL